MTQEIQKAVEAGKLTRNQGAALEKLQPGGYAFHKSWGFGQIESIDYLVNQMTIHFKTKRGHSMQLSYAADSLQPIAPEHILAQKASDMEGVRTRAKENPAEFMKGVLQNYGGKMTAEQITQVLTPDLFSEAEFKRWWEGAKKAMKKDGHFGIPTKKSDPIVLREAAVSRVDEHLAAFSEARQLKDQINTLDRIIKDLEEFTGGAAQLQPIVLTIEAAARKNAKLHTSEAIQLVLARDEIVERAQGLSRAEDAPTIASILRDEERQLRTLLPETPAAKLKRVLAELPAAFPDTWVAKAIDFVIYGNARIVADSARLLQEHKKTEELRSALDRAIRDHSISSAALVWLCDKRERKGEFNELIHPRVLSAIISAMERDQFLESRDRKLNDLLVNDRELIVDLIADASPEELRETTRKLLLTPIFEELNKRSLLGRIVRVYPELQSLITGEPAEKQEALIVSWESLERRKAELEDIVKVQLPRNRDEIAVARSYGDLRENAEYKAAKDHQRVLWRRQAEAERDLGLARGTDFANPDTTQVSIGTTVTVREVADGRLDTWSVLGAWDGDPEKAIISYQTAIAKSLLGHKIGEQLHVPTEHGDRLVEIIKIEAWKKD
jgi:transcription elongation GreA/GreB family factor